MQRPAIRWPLSPSTRESPSQSVQNIIDRKHLDDPLYVRYGYWVQDAVTNGFGTTILGDEPILPDLWRVMKNTLQLVIIAELLAIMIAVFIGVYSALRQYSAFDYTATTFSFLGLAMPVFWFALMLQVAVVYVYQWTGNNIFPIASLSSVDPGEGFSFWIDRAHHLVLPVIVLMVASLAAYTRYMRASMLEVVNSDYVRTARAKGLSEKKVTMKHAFRNALIPMVTLVALNFGALLGGAVIDRDRLLAGRHGPLLRDRARRERSVPDHGVAHDHRDDDHHLQPHRRRRVRLPRSAGSL